MQNELVFFNWFCMIIFLDLSNTLIFKASNLWQEHYDKYKTPFNAIAFIAQFT